MDLDGIFRDTLDDLERQGLLRSLRALPATGGRFVHEGRTCLNFSSNDYLNLANHPLLREGAMAAAERFGTGATASRLMAGHLVIHEELESRLAAFTGQEAALAFPSGYQANVAVMTALSGKDDTIFSDRLNHASIIDGARLSCAEVQIYNHADPNHLEVLLKEGARTGRRIIVTDSLFSMDGDIAPLDDLRCLADTHDAILVVDEAHALGIFGSGRGLCAAFGVRADILIGTLGKALGSGGGFVAASAQCRNMMINRARPFIYSTGLTPMAAGAAMAAISLVEQSQTMGIELLTRTESFVEALETNGVAVMDSSSQVVPIHIGDNEVALRVATKLWGEGLLVTAIRPPTVPEGTARLRLSVTLGHSAEELDAAARQMGSLLKASGGGA